MFLKVSDASPEGFSSCMKENMSIFLAWLALRGKTIYVWLWSSSCILGTGGPVCFNFYKNLAGQLDTYLNKLWFRNTVRATSQIGSWLREQRWTLAHKLVLFIYLLLRRAPGGNVLMVLTEPNMWRDSYILKIHCRMWLSVTGKLQVHL